MLAFVDKSTFFRLFPPPCRYIGETLSLDDLCEHLVQYLQGPRAHRRGAHALLESAA